MIPIREIAAALCPYPFSGRNILVFKFHCDLSYDGNPPKNAKGKPHTPTTYAFAGLFARQEVWDNIERKWIGINRDYGVRRFHAAHLNCKHGDYKKWDDPKKIRYSSELLAVLNEQGTELSGVSCGMLADEYRSIISEDGRRKMGSPYLACFNSCIARVAKAMDRRSFPPSDRFSVLMDMDRGYIKCIDSFNKTRDNPPFKHGTRLGTCAAANMDVTPVLQPADLIAYEVFKWMGLGRKTNGGRLPPNREPLKLILSHNDMSERYFGRETFLRLKSEIESTASESGRLVIIPDD
ncbi:MAG: hypothetical protein ACRD4Q_13140 [Candidatus Acidiferrales bacterium]